MRSTKHQTWMHVAETIAVERGTCPRCAVGCVIVDSDSHVLSTGHNGVPKGVVHCTDVPCEGRNDKSGDTSRCVAIHAEMNAIAWCSERRAMHTLYSTTSPCIACCKLITSTPIKRVVVGELYSEKTGMILLAQAGVTVYQINGRGDLAEIYPNK